MDKTHIAKSLVVLAKALSQEESGGSSKTAAAIDMSAFNSDQQKKVLRFIDAQNTIKDLKAQIKKMTSELETKVNEMKKASVSLQDGLVETLQEFDADVILAEGFIIEYSRKKSPQPKYKEGFDMALDKVNEDTRKQLVAFLETTRTISDKLDVRVRVGSQMRVAGFFNAIVGAIHDTLAYFGIIKRNNAKLEQSVKELGSAVKMA